MKASKRVRKMLLNAGILTVMAVFVFSGCATKKYVGEQIAPVADRVTQAEGKIGQTEGQVAKLGDRVTADEGKITKIEGDLSKVDAKADRAEKALAAFGNLKFERRLTIDMKGDANFEFNSTELTDAAKQKIDGFISGLKADIANSDTAVFLVAGHTDNKGTDDVNYEYGKRRAEMVSRYLVTQKKINPLRIVTASYGESAPVADNNTRDGRSQNRRVEILVYREAINSNAATLQK